MHRSTKVSDIPKVLSGRQWQIATLVCDGLSNRAIAEKLGLTEGTVKVHLHAIYDRLGVQSRTTLMITMANRGKSSLRRS
jgi:two-component system, NarL family, nitrate/nitrite response regulator NarL